MKSTRNKLTLKKTTLKKITLRQCIVCKKRRPKSELTRVVFDKDSRSIILDREYLVNSKNCEEGRGCYFCTETECLLDKSLNEGKRSGLLNRALKINSNCEFVFIPNAVHSVTN